jgi:hypothetical protein
MIKHKIILIAGITISSFFLTNCTGDFEDLNTDPNGLTPEQIGADFTLVSAFMQQAQRAIIPEDVGTYQLAQNLSSDSYSGYMGAQAPFRSNSNNLTYELVDGWNQTIFNYRYINVMNPTYKVIEFAKANPGMEDLEAFARIIRVSAMARVSDKIGPIIYSNYNKPDASTNIKYDTQAEAYNQFFADLEIAINILKGLKGKTTSPQLRASDLAYTGNNNDNWLRLANTLRLRLALRVAYVAPDLAKKQGELALDPANGGLVEDNSQNCFVRTSVNHPLNIIGYEWSDTRMGALMESIMGGYNDPRLSAYFNPSKDPVTAGQYKGIRSGIRIDEKSRYDAYSEVKRIVADQMQIMVAAEAWFLKAEAGLRGWSNAGEVKANYEKGIHTSMSMYGIPEATITAYISNNTSKPKPYIDPKSITAGENDITMTSPYLSTTTILWEDGATRDKKMEKIITQKWIALFPDGEEAWAEYRRTGFPIQFPNIVNFSGGLIPTTPGVRRIPIPQSEYNTNSNAAKEAAQTLNGPDTGATRLWWDVETKN